MPVWIQDVVAQEGTDGDTMCAGCNAVQATWRCLDCVGRVLYCTLFFRDRHQHLPFHWVENWTGSFFKAAWLCQAGLELHLGHGGNRCPLNDDTSEGRQESKGEGTADEEEPDMVDTDINEDDLEAANGCEHSETESSRTGEGSRLEAKNPEDGWESDDDECPWGKSQDGEYGNGLPKLQGRNVIVFVDMSRVHRLRVHYCRCPNAKPANRQFVEMGFLPASVTEPKSVFTVRVLDDFCLMNLECDTAGTSYWHKLVQKTSNVFPSSVPVCPSNVKICCV